MTTVLQQQVFALDAKFNSHRSVNSNNFRKFYSQKKSQKRLMNTFKVHCILEDEISFKEKPTGQLIHGSNI